MNFELIFYYIFWLFLFGFSFRFSIYFLFINKNYSGLLSLFSPGVGFLYLLADATLYMSYELSGCESTMDYLKTKLFQKTLLIWKNLA
jgi:hypothetical protein